MTKYAAMYDFISVICDMIEMRMNRKYGSVPQLKIDEGVPEFDFSMQGKKGKQPRFVVYITQLYRNVPIRIVEVTEDNKVKVLQNPNIIDLSDIKQRTRFLSEIEGIV
tara:strand:+ start:353 stop:676 length:324 start_codon:yes stop_codon:yes gene_type:complete